MESSATTFVLFLAGTGGLVLLTGVVVLAIYAVTISKAPIFSIIYALLGLGALIGFICTTIDTAVLEKDTKRAVIITQTTIFGVLTGLLGVAAYFQIGGDLNDTTRYYDLVMPVSLLLSVVSLSATVMNRLTSVTPDTAATVA